MSGLRGFAPTMRSLASLFFLSRCFMLSSMESQISTSEDLGTSSHRWSFRWATYARVSGRAQRFDTPSRLASLRTSSSVSPQSKLLGLKLEILGTGFCSFGGSGVLVRHAQLPLHPGSYNSRLLKTETAAVERLLRISIGVRFGERSGRGRGALLMRRIFLCRLVKAVAAAILYKSGLIRTCQLGSPVNYKLGRELQIYKAVIIVHASSS